jgi:hypothetical protein
MTLLLMATLLACACGTISLKTFGAAGGVNNSITVAKGNARALEQAMALSSISGAPVVVTSQEDYTFFATRLVNLTGASLVLDGVFRIYGVIADWPNQNNDGGPFCCFYFSNCDNLALSGSGTIDGHGYDWWWYVILTGQDKRPHMLGVNSSRNLTIQGLTLLNSPQFHVLLTDVKDVLVTGVNITVDIEQQKSAFELLNVPVFPLNTDGIDPAGMNIVIENSSIRNYDDAVAVKTTNAAGRWSNCTENVIVRHMKIFRSVGATIGSVSPDVLVSCIRNVTFEDIEFHEALKAIYLKSNPGTEGYGLIENIRYNRIIVYGSAWYPIWIGPQQEKQPDQPSKGCSFFFPLPGQKCETDWRVTFRNIVVENSSFLGGMTLPGVILGDPKNPMMGVVFANVTNSGIFDIQKSYFCQHAQVTLGGTVNPTIQCEN